MFNFLKRKPRRNANVLTCTDINFFNFINGMTSLEMHFSNGHMGYARFSNGKLTIEISRYRTKDINAALNGELIYYFDSGVKGQGFMDFYKMANHLGLAGIGFPPEGLRDFIL